MSTHIEKEEEILAKKYAAFEFCDDEIHTITKPQMNKLQFHLRTSLTRTLEVVEKWAEEEWRMTPKDIELAINDHGEVAMAEAKMVNCVIDSLTAFIRDLKR